MSGAAPTLESLQVLQRENGELREENTVLRAKIAWLRKELFGPGKSEKLDRAQLVLKLEELEKLAAAADRPKETISYEREKGPAPKRTLPAENFAHLPVKETIEVIPEPVREDPTLYEQIGEERTFEVDVIPPQLFKREIVRPKFKHLLDRNRAPLLAPAPPRVVQGGFASAGLIAWALTAKYADHLPLYRQEKMLMRWGAPISRQNLCDWVGAATERLEPLVKRMKEDLLQGGYVQVDETPVRFNDPDLRDGKTTQGWLWALSRPGGDVVFDWRLSRRHDATRPRNSWATTKACCSPTATKPTRPTCAHIPALCGSAAGRTHGESSTTRSSRRLCAPASCCGSSVTSIATNPNGSEPVRAFARPCDRDT